MRYITLVTVLAAVLVGCDGAKQKKNTGWVKVVNAGYMYHKTLIFPNGQQREFYHCDVVGALESAGAEVRIEYSGDGGTMNDCATDVTVTMKPGTVNADGKKISLGTHKVSGSSGLQETMWLNPDNTRCGDLYLAYDQQWNASAFEDMSRTHYFPNRADGVKWMEDNWCKTTAPPEDKTK